LPHSQRISVSARQAEDLGLRLRDWVQRYRLLPAEDERCILDEIDVYLEQISSISQATERGGGIAVLSLRGAATQPVALGLIGATGQGGDRDRAGFTPDRLASLRAGLANSQLATSIRYCIGSQSEAAPAGYPVRVALLDALEVVEIMARVFLQELSECQGAPLSSGLMLRGMENIKRRMQPQSGAGYTGRDMIALRERLNRDYPASSILGMLGAVGYWDELVRICEHIDHKHLVELFAPLWGRQPGLTQLFSTLGPALLQLSGNSEIFLPLEAIAAGNGLTGARSLHPDSILSRQTIERLAEGDRMPIRAVNWRQQTFEVDRMPLAAIAAELVVEVPGEAAQSRTPRHVIELPASGPEQPLLAGLFRKAPPDLETLSRLFAQVKADHLVRRALQRWDATTLAVITSAGEEADASASEAISDWIETSLGETPQQRARRRTGLHVLANATAAAVPAAYALYPDDNREKRQQVLADILCGRAEWASEWTPRHPFNGVYFDMAGAARSGDRGGTSSAQEFRRSDGMRRGGGGEGVVLSPEVLGTRGINSEFLRTLSGALVPGIVAGQKSQQLGLGLANLRRALRSRLIRYNPEGRFEAVEWRRQVHNIVLHHVLACATAGRLGDLHTALWGEVGELEACHDVLSALQARSGSRHPPQDAFALAAVAGWLRSLRQKSRSPRLCRRLELPASVLPHLVDEIAVAAVRTGLASHIAAFIGSLGGDREINAMNGVRLDWAGVAHRMIGCFIEELDLPGTRNPAAEIGPDVTALHPAAGQGTRRANTTSQPRDGVGLAPGARRWCDALGALLDANLASSPTRGVTAGARELSELLSQLSHDPYGVEL